MRCPLVEIARALGTLRRPKWRRLYFEAIQGTLWRSKRGRRLRSGSRSRAGARVRHAMRPVHTILNPPLMGGRRRLDYARYLPCSHYGASLPISPEAKSACLIQTGPLPSSLITGSIPSEDSRQTGLDLIVGRRASPGDMRGIQRDPARNYMDLGRGMAGSETTQAHFCFRRCNGGYRFQRALLSFRLIRGKNDVEVRQCLFEPERFPTGASIIIAILKGKLS
jgi:hypothetical protein